MSTILAANHFGDNLPQGQAGPLGLLVIVLLGLGCWFLYRSMSKHLRRMSTSFDPDRYDEEGAWRPGALRREGPPSAEDMAGDMATAGDRAAAGDMAAAGDAGPEGSRDGAESDGSHGAAGPKGSSSAVRPAASRSAARPDVQHIPEARVSRRAD